MRCSQLSSVMWGCGRWGWVGVGQAVRFALLLLYVSLSLPSLLGTRGGRGRCIRARLVARRSNDHSHRAMACCSSFNLRCRALRMNTAPRKGSLRAPVNCSNFFQGAVRFLPHPTKGASFCTSTGPCRCAMCRGSRLGQIHRTCKPKRA